MRRAAGLAYREAIPDSGSRGTVLMVHGFPQSSYMWRHLLPVVAEAGWRAIAPDLAGYGDSPPDRPGTWMRRVDQLEAFRVELGIDDLVLVVHDWGGLIGLRWACEHPGHLRGLVVSNTGFFPDGRWHDFARTFRTEGEGEQLIDALDRDGLGYVLEAAGLDADERTLDEYWKGFADHDRRRSILEMYRSGEFAELERYEGCLTAMDLPALVLWGEDDPFAPLAGARRFVDELPDARLEIIEGAHHFVYEEAPEPCAAELRAYLAELS